MDTTLAVKVGYQDTRAYPEIYPGSLVFAKALSRNQIPVLVEGTTSRDLFLVEYSGGLVCCRLHNITGNQVVLASRQLFYPHLELRIPEEARILGTLEYEIRFLNTGLRPEVPKRFEAARAGAVRGGGIGQLLRAARESSGLSLREASLGTKQVATALADSRYFAASSSLSQYESMDAPPRRLHKMFSMCILYGVPVSFFLRSISFDGELTAGAPIPDHFLQRLPPRKQDAHIQAEHRTVSQMWSDPTFGLVLSSLLNGEWASLAGLQRLGLHDLYWMENAADTISPQLGNAVVAAVDRHRKRPLFCRSKPAWQQPLYLILHRDGSYECACCSLERGTLVLRSCSADIRPRMLRNGIDAEVIGRVAMVVRRLR
jgi:transcriptional regulator with XRE-family HTH domain